MKDPKRILQLLGMAARARMVVTGEELALREVRSGQAQSCHHFRRCICQYTEKDYG